MIPLKRARDLWVLEMCEEAGREGVTSAEFTRLKLRSSLNRCHAAGWVLLCTDVYDDRWALTRPGHYELKTARTAGARGNAQGVAGPGR